MEMAETGYPLVRNIIHAAWEFADEIGFKPHKDFTSITRYMLEEDLDNIPLIEIECGDENGKPVYVRGPLDSDARASQIIAHLEKTLGKDNFTVIWSDEDDCDGSWSDEEDDEEYSFYEEYFDNSFEENARIYLELNEMHGDSSEEEKNASLFFPKLEALAEELLPEIINDDEFDKWLAKWEEDDTFQISDKTYGAQMIGLPEDYVFSDEQRLFFESEHSSKDYYNFFKKHWPNAPYTHYINLQKSNILGNTNKKLKKYIEQFPDYPMFKIDYYVEGIRNGEIDKKCLDAVEIFGNRKKLFITEYINFNILRIGYLSSRKDLESLDALDYYLSETKAINETAQEIIRALLKSVQLSSLHHYLINEFSKTKKIT
ncbi:MAG: hypothetical protein Q4G63_03975 [Bacteroidia bacterium]|nr:hypothetical protein [Bacteroidia bacterium]